MQFWGKSLQPGKKIEESLHLSTNLLITQVSLQNDTVTPTQLLLEVEGHSPLVIATLTSPNHLQMKTDIFIEGGKNVSLSTKGGEGVIDVIGYFALSNPDDSDDSDVTDDLMSDNKLRLKGFNPDIDDEIDDDDSDVPTKKDKKKAAEPQLNASQTADKAKETPKNPNQPNPNQKQNPNKKPQKKKAQKQTKPNPNQKPETPAQNKTESDQTKETPAQKKETTQNNQTPSEKKETPAQKNQKRKLSQDANASQNKKRKSAPTLAENAPKTQTEAVEWVKKQGTEDPVVLGKNFVKEFKGNFAQLKLGKIGTFVAEHIKNKQ